MPTRKLIANLKRPKTAPVMLTHEEHARFRAYCAEHDITGCQLLRQRISDIIEPERPNEQ